MSEDKAWEDYSAQFRNEVLQPLLDSAIFVSIGTDTGVFDVRQATETGAAIFYDKPIILVVPPGRKISQKLRKVADAVIDNWEPEKVESQERLMEAINAIRE